MDVRKIKGKLREAYPYLREKSLHHWKRTQQTLDAHHTRAQMLEYRKRILEKHQKVKYQNEYDRLRNAPQDGLLRRSIAGGMVQGPRITGRNEENVLRRITELEAQGAKK